MKAGFVGDERGTITIVTAVGVALLLSVTIVAAELGAVVAARHRAVSAADLAALAAADAADHGIAAACAVARAMAGHTPGARVIRCVFEGWDALVVVSLRVPDIPIAGLGTRQVVAFARAGPQVNEARRRPQNRWNADSEEPICQQAYVPWMAFAYHRLWSTAGAACMRLPVREESQSCSDRQRQW